MKPVFFIVTKDSSKGKITLETALTPTIGEYYVVFASKNGKNTHNKDKIFRFFIGNTLGNASITIDDNGDSFVINNAITTIYQFGYNFSVFTSVVPLFLLLKYIKMTLD